MNTIQHQDSISLFIELLLQSFNPDTPENINIASDKDGGYYIYRFDKARGWTISTWNKQKAEIPIAEFHNLTPQGTITRDIMLHLNDVELLRQDWPTLDSKPIDNKTRRLFACVTILENTRVKWYHLPYLIHIMEQVLKLYGKDTDIDCEIPMPHRNFILFASLRKRIKELL